MIHETRIVPLDGRGHVGADIKMWLGDSRGHFEGDTLVVETTNFTAALASASTAAASGTARRSRSRSAIRASPTTLSTTHDRRRSADVDGAMDDAVPAARDDSYGMFEYACHEGNLAMFNILSGARADERKAADSK